MKFLQLLKKNLFAIIIAIVLLVSFIYPPSKVFILQTFLKVGLFKANTTKEVNTENVADGNQISFINKDGIKISTTDMKGRVLFISFWATWCPPCMAEMPSINALYNKLKNNPQVAFIMVDADGDFIKAEKFMQKHNYSLPVYAQAGNIANTIFSGTLPTTIIVDARGNIVYQHKGIANYDTPEMLAFLVNEMPKR